jgi:hypothetical protein
MKRQLETSPDASHTHQHRSLQLPSDAELFQQTQALIDPNCLSLPLLPTNASTPSPDTEFSRNSYLFSSTDSEADGWNVSFIELPPETIFVESIAYNPQYSDDTVYVIGQQPSGTSVESFLYAVNVPDGTVTRLGDGPLKLPEGVGVSTKLTFFGSALTDSGILYATAFNRNSVLYYDLAGTNLTTALGEITNLPSPNDLALDPDDPSSLYVAGGTFRDIINPITARHASTIPGKVYHVDLTSGVVDDVVVDNLRTLAGIEITANKSMWVSQLYNTLVVPGFDDNTTSPRVAWTGSTGENTVWFSDNLDTFDDGRYILSPVYGDPVSNIQVDFTLKDACFSQASFLLLQIIDAQVLTGEPLAQAVLDPEVSLAFSESFVEPGVAPEPLRMIIHDDNEAFHFEIDLVNTRANNPPYAVIDVLNNSAPAQRYFFGNQLTHMSTYCIANSVQCEI